MKTTDACLTIARKELADGLRSRWIWMVSGLLGTSVLAVAFLGTVTVGVAGGQEGGAMIASLMNLAVYLVPLLALILGCGAVIDEKGRGTLDLILVCPVSPAKYFAGTFLGFALALSVAVVSGLGVSGIVLGLWSDVDIGAYALLTGLALVLGLVFLALSFLLSILSRDRGRAVVSSVFVWIGFVLVFDLLILGLLILAGGELPTSLFRVLLLMNPADVFRILCFKWIGTAASPMGLDAVMPFAPPTALLGGVLVLWVAVPFGASYALFRRRVANDTLTGA